MKGCLFVYTHSRYPSTLLRGKEKENAPCKVKERSALKLHKKDCRTTLVCHMSAGCPAESYSVFTRATVSESTESVKRANSYPYIIFPFSSRFSSMNDLLYWVIPLSDMPMLEKPPSWNKVCMVTFLVRSENITTQ